MLDKRHVKQQINAEAFVCDGKVVDPGNMKDMSATRESSQTAACYRLLEI